MTEPRLIPSQPIVQAMQSYRQDGHVRALANAAGVSERTLHRHLSGSAEQIRRHNAARIAAAMGTSMQHLYPPQS